MKLILKLAWRNIWRNKRRAIITMLAVMFAVLLTVFMRGMQLGTYAENIKLSVEVLTGYLQVQVDGYLDNPSLRKTFNYDESIKTILKGNPKIKAFAPRIQADGLIGNSKSSFGAEIFAIDPDVEKSVSKIQTKLKSGKFISNEKPNDIVIGTKLLQNLGAKIGDELVILSSGYDGSTGNMKFRISGTISMGQPDFDRMAVFMNLKTAKELLSMGDRVSSVALNLYNLKDIDEVKSYVNESLKKIKLSNNKHLIALDWGELMPEMKQSIEFDNAGGIVYLAILLIIVAFGILNTLTMSITERFKEFGVMIALGTQQIKLVIIVFFETIFISLIGTLAGMIVGFLANYYVMLNPIKFGGEYAKMYKEIGWEPAMYSTVQPDIFINTAISIFLIVLVVYTIPAFKLRKLEALKGIRYT